MMVELFKDINRKYLDKSLIVFKSTHVDNNRGNNKFSRDNFVTDTQYKTVINLAFKNGLSSFRGELTVVSCFDYRKNIFSFLIRLTEDNEIFIISVFKGKKTMFYNYKTVHNRINLFDTDFVLNRLTSEELNKKNVQKAINRVKELDLSQDDALFDKFADFANIKKL